MEETSTEFYWITHILFSLIMVPVCFLASIVPVLLGRGYVGYSLPTPEDKEGFFGLREFVLLNQHPWLKLKYLLPGVSALLVLRTVDFWSVLGDIVTSVLTLGVMAAIVLGVSFLFTSLDEKPQKVQSKE